HHATVNSRAASPTDTSSRIQLETTAICSPYPAPECTAAHGGPLASRPCYAQSDNAVRRANGAHNGALHRGEGMQHDQNTAGAARAPAAAPSVRLSFREKAGYGIGDFGFNLYWANISAFLLLFYTDVMGLAAAAVGTMMLVTKLFDAVTDPLMGALADRTRTRWGRFRPYLLFGALPLAFTGVLTWTVP